mgnify:CR=1 FL=1
MSKTGELFGTFFKIGAFTFGGGYAMVALLEHEFVEKKRWLTREEFLDMVAIAESTPGPVAVNSATYIGYKLAGVAGAAASTLAVCLPSFAVIYLISLFFDRFFAADGGGQCFQGHSGLCHLPDPVRRGQDAQKLAAHPLQHGSGGGGVGGYGGLLSVGGKIFLHLLHFALRRSRGAGLRDRAGEERRHKMILLELFWNFLVIGAVSFGGGYGMISLVRETVLGHCWLTESEFLSFIAVSESTPGPLAVNMATFIGASQAGLAGSFVATVGVVLPSFVIILLIAAALHSLMKYAGVNAFLAGVRPCVVAMILATACTMGLSTLGGFTTLAGGFAPDVRALAVFALLGILHFAYKKKTQKAPSPIGMILLSAVLGAVLWSI